MFSAHQIRANGQPSDALFRQQQALLRTLPTPSSVMADVLKLWWVWRHQTERPFLRSFALVVLALLFTTTTIADSIFSSLVVDSGTINVLVESPLCGRVNVSGTAWRTYTTPILLSAPTYASDCYRDDPLTSVCNVFMQPKIPLIIKNVSCPFVNSTMCDTRDSVSMDSGLLDVGGTFGLNLAAKDRVRFRQQTTCSIFPIEGFYEIMNLTDAPAHWVPARGALPGEQVIAVYYGSTNDLRSNQTYVASLLMSNITSSPKTLAYV